MTGTNSPTGSTNHATMGREIIDLFTRYGALDAFYTGVVAPLKNGDSVPEGCVLNWQNKQLSVPNRITAHAGGTT